MTVEISDERESKSISNEAHPLRSYPLAVTNLPGKDHAHVGSDMPGLEHDACVLRSAVQMCGKDG